MKNIKPFETFLNENVKFTLNSIDTINTSNGVPKIKPVEVDIKTKSATKEDIQQDVDYYMLELTKKEVQPIKFTGTCPNPTEDGSNYDFHIEMSNGDKIQIYFDGYDEWYIKINGKKTELEGSMELQNALNNYIKKAK